MDRVLTGGRSVSSSAETRAAERGETFEQMFINNNNNNNQQFVEIQAYKHTSGIE